ncbi:MAG: class I SAM-dependent methyltransferase [Candidatus Theseobacter exili]|nr:class I SAM-dependent methyltransferase [Candidatus Theseobacter exili]
MSAIRRLKINKRFTEGKENKKYSLSQEQTRSAFKYKWSKRETYESDNIKKEAKRWLFERYCDGDNEKLKKWLAGDNKIILDAGCGSGFSALLFFGELLNNHDYLGVDISDVIDIAKIRFKEAGYNGDFIETSILDLPVPNESVDMIFSEGVLHHTDNTREAIIYLSKKLKRSGLFLFYVYSKKAVIREFTDDYIRDQLKNMNDENAWNAIETLSKFGISLGKINAEIEIEEDVPLLSIKKGTYNLQRFFYWNICKAYYRKEYSLKEMNHINFDWFRPLNCHRHTKDEIFEYCKEAGLNIMNMNIQDSGITVVATKIK